MGAMCKIWCCACERDVRAALVTGEVVYPHRPDLAGKNFWRCPTCGAYVGCHPGSTRPLGNLPTPELRRARGHIHAVLDPLWKGRCFSRDKIYAEISRRIGREYHTGEIKTIEEARDVWRIVRGIERRGIPSVPLASGPEPGAI